MKPTNPITKTIQVPVYNEDETVATYEDKEVTFDIIRPTAILDGENLILKLQYTNEEGDMGDVVTYISNLSEDVDLSELNGSIQELIQNFIIKKGL